MPYLPIPVPLTPVHKHYMPYHRHQAALGQNKHSVIQMTSLLLPYLLCALSLPPPSRACCLLEYILQDALCYLWALCSLGPLPGVPFLCLQLGPFLFPHPSGVSLDADVHLRWLAHTLMAAPHSTMHSLHISCPVHCTSATWEPCKGKDQGSPECPGTNSATQSK